MFRESPRLRLRPPAEQDIDRFVRWFNDPVVIQNLTPSLPVTEIGERGWLRSLCTTRAKTDIVLVIETKRPRAFPIGNVGIHKLDHRNANAEVSVVIGEKRHWGKGLGTEAMALMIDYGFCELNLHRIYTGAFAFNRRSIVMLRKLGFVQEGVQRQAVFANGAYHNILQFGLLRSEWKRSHRKR
jgi:RimJ/RimL family protein N-acetyltransferase